MENIIYIYIKEVFIKHKMPKKNLFKLKSKIYSSILGSVFSRIKDLNININSILFIDR